MSRAQQLPLTSTWQNLGNGPLSVHVVSGVAMFLACSDIPASDATNGTIVAAIVGAPATSLADGALYWAKAVVTSTTILVEVTSPADPPAPPQSSDGVYGTYEVPISTKGQTTFDWPNGSPVNLSDVGFLVNGVEYRPPDISALATALVWNGLFTLDPATETAFARYR